MPSWNCQQTSSCIAQLASLFEYVIIFPIYLPFNKHFSVRLDRKVGHGYSFLKNKTWFLETDNSTYWFKLWPINKNPNFFFDSAEDLDFCSDSPDFVPDEFLLDTLEIEFWDFDDWLGDWDLNLEIIRSHWSD